MYKGVLRYCYYFDAYLELPGGHCIHPLTLLEDELEYVPGGHGRNFMSEE